MKKISVLIPLISLFVLSGCTNSNPPLPPDPPKPEPTGHEVDLTLGEVPTYEEDSISFHYWRKDCSYVGWDMWLWESGHDGAAYEWNAKDDWGVVASYPLSTWTDAINNQLGFIIRKGGDSWLAKDCGGQDLFVDFSLYYKDEKGVYHIYMISGDSNLYLDTNMNMRGKINMATFATTSRISVRTNIGMTKLLLKKEDNILVENEKVGNVIFKQIDLPNNQKCDFSKNYTIEATLKNGDILKSPVSKTLIFKSEEFAEAYNYDGELGALYTNTNTEFKVWSPASTDIKLRIYDTGTPKSLGGNDEYAEYQMIKGEKGVFTSSINGDLEGKYYTYVVTNSNFKSKEIVDPYAKSTGINGLRGMIVDFNKTDIEGWKSMSPIPYDRKELVVYETHVADITSSHTWGGTPDNAKLFKGAFESGTTYAENGMTVSTGFDHIKEMGVNAVQLIPIFDQANDEEHMTFNWGYNPLNYNSLEGGYSSNPYDGYTRIREFKELVKSYHDAGINIIMDVVYNHVSGANGSNFDVLMPGYYYRYTNSLDLSNGSGCGNETASENYMMRKFIVDSTKFWAEEYKLGGFRFDLMGLHDLETMETLVNECKTINPNIVIYGEPWTGGTTSLDSNLSAAQANGNKYKGYGAFNDQMRDALIKGGLAGANELGWITDNISKVDNSVANKLKSGIIGTTSASSIIADPDKTVNYVTCHDNYTLFDRIVATKRFDGVKDYEAIKKMNVLANSVVLTSQGTSFLLAGEEFLRTKQGNSNSYNSSYEVNELDYSLKIKNMDMVNTYKELIRFKKECDGLHLNATDASKVKISMSSDFSMITYDISWDSANYDLKIIHVNGLGYNDKINLSAYEKAYSTINGVVNSLGNEISIKPYETLIAYKNK